MDTYFVDKAANRGTPIKPSGWAGGWWLEKMVGEDELLTERLQRVMKHGTLTP